MISGWKQPNHAGKFKWSLHGAIALIQENVMAELLFSKDECAPDSKTARQWLREQGLDNYWETCPLRIDIGDGREEVFLQDGKYYSVCFYQGVYEEVHEITRGEVINKVGGYLKTLNIYPPDLVTTT